MGIFDWIPSVEEVFEFVECRLSGHIWGRYRDDEGFVFRRCKTCGKVEK